MRFFVSILLCFTNLLAFSQAVTAWKNGEVVAVVLNPDSVCIENNYVDLGLSVKWAKCNVGAKECYEYGNFYAWAETCPKNQYDWTTYKYSQSGATKMTKYSISSLAAIIDGRLQLEPDDDAASINCGPYWRTPTLNEMNELGDNCDWRWTSNYQGSGIPGYIVTSKIEGFTDNYIFLPAAGHMGGKSHYDYDPKFSPKGMYWTSTLDVDGYASIKAAQLYFGEDEYLTMTYDREIGMTVRPVLGEAKYNNTKLPIFLGDIQNNSNRTYFIVYIRLKPMTGYPLTDYGWQFSFDDQFSEVIDAKTLQSPIITYDSTNGILQLALSYNYVIENFYDAYIRAYATCSEGTVYSE